MIVQQQRPLMTSSRSTVDEAARMMKRSKASAMMVVDDDRLVGIFTERDALFRVVAAGRDPHATRLSSVMTRNPKTIDPDKPFGYALFLMYEGGFHHVPVVENGRPVGLVSARDALGPELREFGEEMESHDHIGEILG
jgi:CBS domain-containing protein